MLRIYNTLSRIVEDFNPIDPPYVGVYTCGPTVYDYAHIGNFRTYTAADLLVRVLKYNKFDPKYIMNLTDVGHLTGDNQGDADTGEDRMEKSAKKEGKSAWDIAEFYTDAFLKDYERLNLTKPIQFTKATDHIQDQIDLILKLEEKGFTYKTSDGIYFDTSKFPDYGKLSNLDEIKEGARVDANPEKKNPRDFALWKFSSKDENRQMEWKSPWGVGFPGWHIECSAMSMRYLGPSFDIHVGGIDLSSTHHPNEIAQSEAATGKQFVKYWVHGAFMLVDGKRMSKSLQNNYRVADIVEKGFDPLALRYLYLTTHYRQEMNFTWEGLEASQKALNDLWEQAEVFSNLKTSMHEPSKKVRKAWEEFHDSVNNDLNIPKALGALHSGLKIAENDSDKVFLLSTTDEVLGLELKERGVKSRVEKEKILKSPAIMSLVQQREKFRREKRFDQADQIRNRLKKMGYEIRDEEDGKTSIKKI